MTTTTEHTVIDGIDIDKLYVSAIDVKPVNFSWDYETNYNFAGSDGTWQHFDRRTPEVSDEATCEHCGETIAYDESGWWHMDAPTDDEEWDAHYCDGDFTGDEAKPDEEYHAGYADGPMMNYYYPLQGLDAEDAAETLARACLPLCVVEVEGETGLALTGGGMDLSWQICEAYVRLGYLPPVHFASDLPKMCMPLTTDVLLVAAAGKRACRIEAEWALRGVDRIDETVAWIKEYNDRER